MPAIVIKKLSPKMSPRRIFLTASTAISNATRINAAIRTSVPVTVPGSSSRRPNPSPSSAAPAARIISSFRASAGSCSWLWSWPQLQPPWSW